MPEIKKFAGCLYLSPVNEDGTLKTPGLWFAPGESAKLEIQLQEETSKIMGRTCRTFGKVIAATTKISDATGSMTLLEYTVRNVAMALKGLVTTNNIAAETLNNKTVTLGQLGEWAEIGAGRLDNVVVTDSGGTELVEETDYNIDQRLGLITPLKESLAGATVNISAESAAERGPRIAIGGAGVAAKYAIKGHLVDEFTGKRVDLYLRKVTIAASSAVNFVSEDSATNEQLEFSLTPEIPTGKSDYGTIDGLAIA